MKEIDLTRSIARVNSSGEVYNPDVARITRNVLSDRPQP